ncbi:MAG: MarR family winged helix-turn-helix transcriptional regulator [Pseudoalteromonas spongiae]
MISLDSFLPYRLARLSNALSNSFAKVYADKYGLTVPQWRVIAHLAQQSNLTAKDICDRAELDKSTASRAVKQLIEKGIVVGMQDEKDKRATVLALTKAGEQLFFQLASDANNWQNALFDKLTHEEQSTLFTIINKLDDVTD